jgi:hypothetical protein
MLQGQGNGALPLGNNTAALDRKLWRTHVANSVR